MKTEIVKKSFISNLIGRNTYDTIKEYAKKILAIGTCVLAVLFGLSFICHYSFVSSLLSLVTGTSLLFILYIAALIISLDHEVEVEETILDEGIIRDRYESYEFKDTKILKTKEYKLTILWGVVCLLLGIAAIYFSNKYRKHYAFECDTFLVDKQASIYHLDWDNDCEVAVKSSNLEKMQGYQIDKNFTLCEWCYDWAEDAEYNGDDYTNN